jgi:EAL and modified HD-GYP domain-containing signal transduction protein
MSQIFIARQPIFNRKLHVAAYELLYRAGDSNLPAAFDHDYATSQVLVQAFSGIGLDSLVGERTAFINLTASFIYGSLPIPFSPSRVILEVPETLPVDSQLLESLRRLAVQGYKLALDDVIDIRSVFPLLETVHYVKLDLAGVSRIGLHKNIRYLKAYNVLVVAEKVETQEDYLFCKWAGADLFQGYFFSKPKIFQE